MTKRKICVFTGSRADYGLLKPLLEHFRKDEMIELVLIVSGSHLSPEFGLTLKFIEQDDIQINEKIEILLSSDTPVGIAKSMGLGMISFGEALQKHHPDLVVVLGDRYEAFSFATCALILRIPIAHISGGDTTEGAIDEALRHSISKMSHFHFVSNDDSFRRVIQLGEKPSSVFNVGAIGLDYINKVKFLTKEELESALDFKFLPKNLLITFHSTTLEEETSEAQAVELLKALSFFQNVGLIFTKANADTDGRIINELIEKFVSENVNSKLYSSMGHINYLSALKYVNGVIGNSSSGIYEAPSFKIGTVNIGDRQKGRIQAKSVLNCRPKAEEIKKSIEQVLSSSFDDVVNPYYKKDPSREIYKILKEINLESVIKKEFYNI